MKMKFEYTLVGDVYLPNLISTEINYEIGFWEQKHKEYLKQNHRLMYYNLLTQGKLNTYLHNIDIRAKKMRDELICQFAEKEKVTEKLKAENQMFWVQQINNIRNRVMEIVNADLIYS